MSQHSTQLLDLLFIFLKKGILGVLVDSRLVLYGFGSIGIVQGAQGLIIVIVGWGEGRDHDRLGVATKGVL